MHLYREHVLSKFFTNLTIIRPTLIFGSDDPHNGYGPNSFIRLAQSKNDINLFGKGEEIRDHIYIGNVVECIVGSIKKNIFTDINCVTSKEISFYKIAKLIKFEYPDINFHFNVRKSKMPHNGFRVFDNKKLKKYFPKIKFLNIEKWIKDRILYKNKLMEKFKFLLNSPVIIIYILFFFILGIFKIYIFRIDIKRIGHFVGYVTKLNRFQKFKKCRILILHTNECCNKYLFEQLKTNIDKSYFINQSKLLNTAFYFYSKLFNYNASSLWLKNLYYLNHKDSPIKKPDLNSEISKKY